jgi:hypothetical protein
MQTPKRPWLQHPAVPCFVSSTTETEESLVIIPRRIVCLIAIVGFLAAGMTGCVYDPDYDGSLCGPGQTCPDGYICDPAEKICKRDDYPVDEPTLDADGGSDAGGDDGQSDAGDPDSGDTGPCSGGCPTGSWCDANDNSCKPCSNPEHCGPACNPCEVGETCQNLGADGYCCLSPCEGFEQQCQRKQCNGATYICKAGFPLTWAWVDVAGPLICALSQEAGIVAEETVCNPANENGLLFFCPWGGSCQADESCSADPSYGHGHRCGDMYGCQDGQCRMHLQDDQPCIFNWDCESFCCSRTQNSTCIPSGDSNLCKITRSLYWRSLFELRSFTAEANPDPHDRNGWGSSGSNDSPGCSEDWECDTGLCKDDLFVLGTRCFLARCVVKASDGETRSSYFCDHEVTVTNPDPEPATPAECFYQE